MKFYISVVTHCPRISIERKVICYPLFSGGFGCKGCKDANESEICKNVFLTLSKNYLLKISYNLFSHTATSYISNGIAPFLRLLPVLSFLQIPALSSCRPANLSCR